MAWLLGEHDLHFCAIPLAMQSPSRVGTPPPPWLCVQAGGTRKCWLCPLSGPMEGTRHRSQAGPPQKRGAWWCRGGFCVSPPVPRHAGSHA